MRGVISKIQVDIDKDRIREIVEEAVRMIHEYLGGNFIHKKEDVLQQLESIVETDRVTTQFLLKIGSSVIPDMMLRVDPIKRKVLCISSFRKKVAKINRFMRIL